MQTIYVTSPGSLKEQLEDNEWKKLKCIKIAGELNDIDFKWIDDLQTFNKGLYIIDLFDTKRQEGCNKPIIIERGINTLNIPEGIKEIKKKDFLCLSINTLNIPKTIFKIEKGAFNNCPELKVINVNEQNLKYRSINGILYTKDGKELLYCPIKREGTITIQEGVKKIAPRAFQGCDKLKAIIIPASINKEDTGSIIQDFTSKRTEIRWVLDQDQYDLGDTNYSKGGEVLVRHSPDAEDYKEGMPKFDLFKKGEYDFCVPNGVVVLSENSFCDCFQLKSIKLPHSLSVISSSAFKNCTHMEAIEIPDKVKEIGEDCFSGCRSLGKICCWANTPPKCKAPIIDITNDKLLYIPKGTLNKYKKASGWKLFKNIREVETLTTVNLRMSNGEKNIITFSPSITKSELKDYLKEIWHNVAKVSIVGKINDIDFDLLRKMSIEGQLSDVDLTGCLISELPKKAFADAEKLVTIQLPNSLNRISNSCFIGCKKLKRINIGTNTKIIDNFAFAECISLKSCVFGGAIEEIGRGVCWNCKGLETIIFGENIRTINEDCFRGCENITTIYCKSFTPPVCQCDTFTPSVIKSAQITYPASHISNYLNNEIWNSFNKKTAENILF